MKKFFLSILLINLFFLQNHCGFKVVKYEGDKNYNVVNFQDLGNNNINYTIQRNLVVKQNDQSPFNLNMEINTKLKKTIKEKNISNEITKYDLNVITNVKIQVIKINKEFEFTVNDRSELKASNKINKLKYDENIILKRMANNISNQINRKIVSLLNDL